MATAPDSSGAAGRARFDAGAALVGVGAVALLVSLFLDWYRPGRSAWTVFEVWDLVLAALAVWALVAVAGTLGATRLWPRRWLLASSVAAVVIVVESLVNHPPAALGYAPMVGIWVALGASVLMCVGAVMSVARISLWIEIAERAPSPRSSGAARRVRLTSPLRRRRGSAGGTAAPGGPPTEPTQRLGEEPEARPGPSGEER